MKFKYGDVLYFCTIALFAFLILRVKVIFKTSLDFLLK